MSTKSKWILCSKTATETQWRILGYIEPQPNLEKLHAKIAIHYAGREMYGIWIVDEHEVIRSAFVSAKNVTPVSRIFKSTEFVKSYADIIEGMMFIPNSESTEAEKPLRVLAAREGFCMVTKEGEQPFVIHWKKLVSQYIPQPKI